MKIALTEGLGDCIVAAAAIQKYAVINKQKIFYITDSRLKFLFNGHPGIQFSSASNADIKLEWVSRLSNKPFHLHTMNRFGSQLGLNLAPDEVLDPYIDGIMVSNDASKPIVAINALSAEPHRRFIPKHIVDLLASYCVKLGYKPIYVGANYEWGIYSIPEITNILLHCKLFIGPISFCYHLASALKTQCLTFFSYMQESLFSHVFNTTPVISEFACIEECEAKENITRKQMNCWDTCKAATYDSEYVLRQLHEALC